MRSALCCTTCARRDASLSPTGAGTEATLLQRCWSQRHRRPGAWSRRGNRAKMPRMATISRKATLLTWRSPEQELVLSIAGQELTIRATEAEWAELEPKARAAAAGGGKVIVTIA